MEDTAKFQDDRGNKWLSSGLHRLSLPFLWMKSSFSRVNFCCACYSLRKDVSFWSMGHILENTVLLQLLETPCSPHHSLLTLLDLLTFLFLLRLGCHLGRTDMDPSHVVSGCCGVGLDPNACQIECQKECQIECQSTCQIEFQIEGQSMCQIECQLVGITRRM